jgi:hypothetical protein
MSYRTLAILPILVAAAFVAAVLAQPSDATYRVGIEVAKLLGLVGSIAASLAFVRGDYLRPAWALSAACLGLLLLRDTTMIAGFPLRGASLLWVQSALVIAANACSVVSVWLMARAWHVAGLDPENRRAPTILGIGVALLIAGGALLVDVRAIASGNYAAFVPLASDLGDMISLSLIAPVVMTALAMRGGVLRWPWGLFAVSLICWLFYDATNAVRQVLPSARLINETFRILACTYLCAAGFAQREAVK